MSKNKLLIAITAGLFAATGAMAQTSSGNSSNATDTPLPRRCRTVRRRLDAQGEEAPHKQPSPSTGKKTPDQTKRGNGSGAAENGQSSNAGHCARAVDGARGNPKPIAKPSAKLPVSAKYQTRRRAMSPRDLLLASVVILAWGVNFVVIKVGLHGVPPMLLGALRFSLAAVPAIFFVKRPNVPLRWLLAYGLTISLGQFAFLFYAMYVGMPAGLASLVLQAQAFFTLIFAAMFLHERIRAANLAGLVIAACGLALIGMQGGHAMTFAGFMFTLAAAAMWALGNVVTKRMGRVDLVSLVVWGKPDSAVAVLRAVADFRRAGEDRGEPRVHSVLSMFAIAYLAFVATLVGYSLWGKLLARYPASQVAPFSLLVPIIGLASAAVLLGEALTPTQIAGAALVMAGLAVNVFGGWLVQRFAGALTKYAAES